MTTAAGYDVPTEGLGLKGPVARPAPGTIPLRGDLAHIALADRYLVPHYVVPQIYAVVGGGAELKLNSDAASETLAELPEGSRFEVLDLAGDWYWGGIGPDGPSGYVIKSALSQDAP